MKLGVNVDHVATLRQARGGYDPDPVEAAKVCQKAGVHSIVMHLREDRRHIQDRDLFRAKKALQVKLNLEMAAVPAIITAAMRLKPGQVTLVPEKRRERTTETGLDLFSKNKALETCIRSFKKKNILVSLFIDTDFRQIREAVRLGADAVEFHTGPYANSKTLKDRQRELEKLKKSVAFAIASELVPHAGHGLDYENVRALKNIRGLDELNIGYSIVSRALWVGLDAAVREMLGLIR